MAHKKGVGSSKNGRESASQRLGVKIWGGQKATSTSYLRLNDSATKSKKLIPNKHRIPILAKELGFLFIY